jgi:hypothetical protein
MRQPQVAIAGTPEVQIFDVPVKRDGRFAIKRNPRAG